MAWTWTEKKTRAAQMVAEDEKTNEQIAAAAGVSRQALDKWKTAPEFRQRVREIVEALQQHLERYGIARKDKRVAVLDAMLRRGLQIVDEREQQYDATGELDGVQVPGGRSGFIVRKPLLVKVFEAEGDGQGESDHLTPQKASVMAYEYAFDAAHWKGLLDAMKQAAQETGQMGDKSGTEVNVNIDLSWEGLVKAAYERKQTQSGGDA